MIDVDTLSGMAPLRRVAFSLGSNLGDRLGYLQDAVDLLSGTPGLIVTDVSGVYETEPVGFTDQPDFLNITVLADSTLASMVMLDRAQAIESGLHRVRAIEWGPRTIDIDLIAVGDRILHGDALTLPHPRAHERAFVLLPWLELDPEAVLVGKGRVADLVAELDTSGVRRLDDVITLG